MEAKKELKVLFLHRLLHCGLLRLEVLEKAVCFGRRQVGVMKEDGPQPT